MVETAAYVLRNLTEAERQALVRSLLCALQDVRTDQRGFFSRNRYAEARGGLKRHQANQELGWLIDAGFVVHFPGEENQATGRQSPDKYSVNGRTVRDTASLRSEPLPTPSLLLCLRLLAEKGNLAKQVAMVESEI